MELTCGSAISFAYYLEVTEYEVSSLVMAHIPSLVMACYPFPQRGAWG